jgi:hypothetical protein
MLTLFESVIIVVVVVVEFPETQQKCSLRMVCEKLKHVGACNALINF